MSSTFRVLGIAGSLRKQSYNRALLRTATQLAPASLTFETAEWADFPPYDADVEAAGRPESVVRFRAQIAAADAILIATPEYNYSIPGGLKNAVDWASRPPEQPFNGKLLGIIGASGGDGGTMRSQYHWRQVAVFLNLHVMNKPEVFVRRAGDKFDAEGNLTDEAIRKTLTQYMQSFAEWIASHKK
ncbi:NAD(P)H-dependent oxidoreductase [Pendulispora brunnea]|uniref:NAD(P)H-dependent oxidoreductase n=1 Tax=Pendulispora brunnea TaxID=2905690 RepID=A0ABZ2K2Y8_9BACT